MRRLGNRAPSWLSLLLAVTCVALGAVIVLRPFTSLSVLRLLIIIVFTVSGIADLLAAPRAKGAGRTAATGVVWLIAALLTVLYPGQALHALAVVVGLALIVGGLARVLGTVQGGRDERAAVVLGGLASAAFGALALAWPDVTLLVVAVVFGARTILFGCTQAIEAARAVRGRSPEGAPTNGGGRWLRGWPRTVAMACSLALALALLAVGTFLHQAAPSPNAFYKPPASVPATPGTLLRSEPFTQAVPKTARALRILYTTTRDDGVPAVASGIVLVAKNVPPKARPVIAWAHGTTGVVPGCAPSLLKNPFEAGALPALDQIIAKGWVLVATDYTGLGTAGPHPYLVGQGEARPVLDAVRAARHLAEISLSGQTVVWGHSQGGHAALWTGQIQPSYAPDVPLDGVAALAPASDLTRLVANLSTLHVGSIFASYVASAYSQIYPDVSFTQLIRPEAQAQVRAYASRCLAEPATLVSAASSLLADQPVFSQDPATGATGSRLRQNTPTGHIRAPLLIAQGESDPLILPAVQRAFVKQACNAGGTIDYRTYPGRDHVSVVAPTSALIPDLLHWTQDRFNGIPAPNTCA